MQRTELKSPVAPTRQIKTHDDLERWKVSKGYHHILGFVLACNDAVNGLKVSDAPAEHSPAIESILSMLETMNAWMDEIPPISQPMRFGNKAFRTWYERLGEHVLQFTRDVLPDDRKDFAQELAPYLQGGFGNEQRIDYGTGHELSFLAWVCGLAVCGALEHGPDDLANIVFKVFVRYLALVRRLQTYYSLEPAGSHGVWGLDDYQFLPFIFGAAQLRSHKYLKPKSVLNAEVLEGYAHEYLYLAAVAFVHTIKTGPFFEHSPYLHDIAQLDSWARVNSGLVKMYRAECLGKFPVVQHFVFGSIFSLDPAKPEDIIPENLDLEGRTSNRKTVSPPVVAPAPAAEG